jgi:hypothetical protein
MGIGTQTSGGEREQKQRGVKLGGKKRLARRNGSGESGQ